MDFYRLGKAAASGNLGMSGNDLIQGAKLDLEKPKKKPEADILPPPPHATSGTALNPKVA